MDAYPLFPEPEPFSILTPGHASLINPVLLSTSFCTSTRHAIGDKRGPQTLKYLNGLLIIHIVRRLSPPYLNSTHQPLELGGVVG